MPETLANPYGLLGRAALEQMKLAPVSRRELKSIRKSAVSI
jgi:hypothetical protein